MSEKGSRETSAENDKPSADTKSPPKSSSDRLAGIKKEEQKMLHITVKNVMEGVPQVKVDVPATATVRDLKLSIADSCDVFADKQLLLYKDKELKEDDAPLASYGMTDDCSVTMNVKMSTGVSRRGSGGAELIFYVPTIMPQGNVTNLRTVIRGMSTVKSKAKKVDKSADKKTQIWTAEKQLEHELTRNRMKSLLKKRKRTKLLSDTCDSNNGSIIGSAAYSPITTPPPELASASASKEGSSYEPTAKEVTDKELKLFFEPAESLQQLATMRKDWYLPPQNQKELEELKQKFENLEKTRCKSCRKKLPLAEQTMACLCKKVFCAKHRKPENHLCIIDYKQTGRSKLQKENPKVDGGGARKAKAC